MKYRFMRFPGFRTKAVTFSFDDGFTYDRRLVELMNRCGIRGTFNIIGNHYTDSGKNRLTAEELRTLYFPNGHEVANHGMNHRALINLTPAEGMLEVIEGRRAAEQFYHRIIRGFVYPDRSEINDAVRSWLPMTGAAYARTGRTSGTFDLPTDFMYWKPTCKHTDENALTLAQQFLDADPRSKYCAMRDSLLYFVWGHSFECPNDDWQQIERLCALLHGHEDIWYATNIDICDYINAYRALITSTDNMLLYNPGTIRLWLDWDDRQVTIGPGETITVV